ncbi:hypothetical protein CC78DRAFT_621502 [Lojkania enalia]|uniref:Uncharacterized protein n=1 Tax=Lojkania enalia TaxID=147567 RepID=A0A9P4N1K6_9PLEO|nr:hypothetical protein CC78DRAFT_621502 [Didymosphaeria enalia]
MFSSEKTEVEHSKDRLKEWEFSILTMFMSILGARVDSRALSPMQLLTESSDNEIPLPQARLHHHRAQDRLRGGAKSYTSRAHDGKVVVIVDGTGWSGGTAPVNVELGVEGKTKAKKSTTWEGSSDFVFAFRVRKAHVSKKTRAVDENDDNTKDALLEDKFDKIKQDLSELSILA